MTKEGCYNQYLRLPRALRIAKEYEDLITVDRHCFDEDRSKRNMAFALITLSRTINSDREFINRDDVKWGIYMEMRAKVVASKKAKLEKLKQKKEEQKIEKEKKE